jgi:hypothetical protein
MLFKRNKNIMKFNLQMAVIGVAIVAFVGLLIGAIALAKTTSSENNTVNAIPGRQGAQGEQGPSGESLFKVGSFAMETNPPRWAEPERNNFIVEQNTDTQQSKTIVTLRIKGVILKTDLKQTLFGKISGVALPTKLINGIADVNDTLVRCQLTTKGELMSQTVGTSGPKVATFEVQYEVPYKP